MLKGSKHSIEVKQKIKVQTKRFFDQHPETKEQMSEAIKKYHQLNPQAASMRKPGAGIYKRTPSMKTGKYIRTEQARKNIGLAAKGRIDSKETREKKRQHMKEEWKKNPHRIKPGHKRRKPSPETLLKMHYSHLGKRPPLKQKWSAICLGCKEPFEFPSGTRKGQKFCNRDCYERYKLKNAKWLWKKKGYSKEFNNVLKNKIRTRDNFKCQLCGVPEIECLKRLDVHHIDYNRKNCVEDNLIALCRRCNSDVNNDREFWKLFFTNKINNIKEVRQDARIK